MCEPQERAAAVDEIMHTRSDVPDDELLRTTRRVAAAHVASTVGAGAWQSGATSEHDTECDDTAARLAARASGELGGEGKEELERHLAACGGCRAVELKQARAERAFAAVLSGLVPSDLLTGKTRAQSTTPTIAIAAPEPREARGRRFGLLAAVPRAAVLGAVAVLVAAAAASAIFLSGGGPSKHVTATRPAGSTSTAAAKPAHQATRHVRHHAAVHRRRPNKPVKHAKPAPSSTPATPTAVASTPTPAPVTNSAPVSVVHSSNPSPPVNSQPSSSSPSVTIQGGNSLPAQNAPTQGIGSGHKH